MIVSCAEFGVHHFVSLLSQDMLYILDWMEELKARLLSEDYGKHLMGVEDLIQVHLI